MAGSLTFESIFRIVECASPYSTKMGDRTPFLEVVTTTLKRKLSGRHGRHPSLKEAIVGVGSKAAAVGNGGRAIPSAPSSTTKGFVESSKQPIRELFIGLGGQNETEVEVIPNFKTSKKSGAQPQIGGEALPDTADEQDHTVVDIEIFTTGGRERRLAKADTGSPHNFIANQTICDSGLRDRIQHLQAGDPRAWVGACGTRFEAIGRVSLRWNKLKSVKSWDTVFFVVESDAFDVILGFPFLQESKYITIDPSAFIIHEDRSSKAKEKDKRNHEATTKAKQKEENKRAVEAERKEREEKASNGTKRDSKMG